MNLKPLLLLELILSVFVISCDKENTTNTVTPEFSTFAGLQIAPGPLYYNGISYEIAPCWNHDSYGSAFGKVLGSTYFNFIEMGQLFEKKNFNSSDGDIDNLLDPFSGWRLPTNTEWAAMTTNTSARDGSTVNGSAGKHYALV